MALRKRFPGSSFDDPEPTSSKNNFSANANATSSDLQAIFVDSYITNINYKPEQAFDFEAYKTKVVNGLEIFGEDITNLKSNLNHIFGIADFHLYKDFHEVTNELVTITQMKLDEIISKSNSDVKNFNDQEIANRILQKFNANQSRKAIQNYLSRAREELADFFTEDKYYKRTSFLTSDLSLQLEKLFKLYDVFDNENGLINYLKLDENKLYEKLFRDETDIAYSELLLFNSTSLQERLEPEKLYRIPAAISKERLLFRIDEIINAKVQNFPMNSISSYIKTQLLREKYNIKNNLAAIFKKVIPDGVKLNDDVEKQRKEIAEELSALREGVAYLDTHHKSYIKILTGTYHPQFILGLGFNSVNVDILIDIEKLFFIIDDITSRLGGIMSRIKQYRNNEENSIENGIQRTMSDVIDHLEGLPKQPETQGIINEIFSQLDELMEKERKEKSEFRAEKERLGEERKRLEGELETRIQENLQNRASATVAESRDYKPTNDYAPTRSVVETRSVEQKSYSQRREEERTVSSRNDDFKPKPVEKPVQKPVEKPVERQVEKPVEKVPDRFSRPEPAASKPKSSYEDLSLQSSSRKEEKITKEETKPYSYNSSDTKPYETKPYSYNQPEEKKPQLTTPWKEEKKVDLYDSKPKIPPIEEKKPAIPEKKSFNDSDIVKEVDKINNQLKKDDLFKSSAKKPATSGFFDGIDDDIDEIDTMIESQQPKKGLSPVSKLPPVKESPKAATPKKEEPKPVAPTSQSKPKESGFWDFEDVDDIEEIEDLDDKPPAKAPAPLPKKDLPPLKKGGLEPMESKPFGKLDSPGLAPLKGKLDPIGSKTDESEDKGSKAPQKLSAVDKLYGKLGNAPKEEAKVKDFDDDIEDEYAIDDFDEDDEPPKSKSSPPAKEKPKEQPKEQPKPAGALSLLTAEKLDLINEHIEQEAELFNQAIDPEALNDLDILVNLFQEFFSQLKLFVFDYPETEMILNEAQDNIEDFKKSSVAKSTIKEIAESLKKYYLEMLSTETQVSESNRFFIPFGPQDDRIPFVAEVDLDNKSFTYIYFGEVPTDRESENFIKEFHNLIKDIFIQLFDSRNVKDIDLCSLNKVGLDQESQNTVGQVEQAAYLRVMLIIYYLLYETDKVTKNITISIDNAALSRFFCTLTSLLHVKRFLDSPAWDQYSEFYLSMSDQLSDGQSCIVKYLPYESSGTDYPVVQKKILQELQGIHGKFKSGLKEAIIAIDVMQAEARSVYYLHLTSEFEPAIPKKDYKLLLFTITANEPDFDTQMIKTVKDMDKAGKTEVIIYTDYIRHSLNYQFAQVTLGAWAKLMKENQFAPEEAMVLIIYNMNGYHLDVQAEGEFEGTEKGTDGQGGEDEEGDDGDNYGAMMNQNKPGQQKQQQEEEEDDYENDFDELPIDDIEDDF